MNAKLIIVSLFVIMVILGVVGVFVYYQSLAPLRDVRDCGTIGDVLDRVSYLEYNITDKEGNYYLVKLNNDPSSHSGKIEYYKNAKLVATAQYSYSNRLDSFSIHYVESNTTINVSGNQAYVFEDKFYTSLNITYNESQGITYAEPFPGVAPLYLVCYVGKATDINWSYYANIRKSRDFTYGIMDVRVSSAKTLFMGEETNAVVVSLVRRGGAPNMWALPIYQFVLVDYNGLAVANSIVVDIATPTYANTFTFQLVSIQLAG